MSFLRAERAAPASQCGLSQILATVAVVLAGLSLSCGNSSPVRPAGPSHNAYVTLPQSGSVLLLHIDGATGAITLGAQTPTVENTSPAGLALLGSKKFLYVANARANTISIFNVASDGTLTLSGTPTPAAGSTPNAAVIDPSGKYLLVTNQNSSGSVSVFSIDSGSGALSELTGSGSPFFANAYPSEILITPSGKFVYVTNPGLGIITAFTFSNGVLTKVPGSPFPSLPGGGGGSFGLAVDGSEQFLYVANPSAPNPLLGTTGNISGFEIDPVTGALSPLLGSPFASTVGNGPTALTVDPSGKFLYATATGSSSDIWCFQITPANGQLVAVTNSPFSLTVGGLFALFDPSGNYFYVGTQAGIAGYTYSSSTGVPTAITGSPFSTGTPPGKMVLSE